MSQPAISDRAATPHWTLPEIRLVCLDIDDTLVNFSAASRTSLHALTGRSELWECWERITENYVDKVVSGEIPYPGMHIRRTQEFLVEIGVAAETADAAAFEEHRAEILARSWRLFDDVVPCLEWLTATGVRLAAVTNASGDHQRAKLADLGLEQFFDHIAIAGELGSAKPDPGIFDSVCRGLECAPAQAVHIGDRLFADAVGARDAGLHGVWLNRRAEHGAGEAEEEEERRLPSYIHVLESLDQLPQLLVAEFAAVTMPAPR